MRKYVWKQWLCAAALTALVLSGCGQKASAAGNIPDTAMTTEPVEDTAGADMTKGKADGPEDQADVQSSASMVEIKDMGGRSITIPAPDKLERMYPDGSTSLLLLYTLAPDRMTAAPSNTGNAFSEEQRPFILPEVCDLPSYGTRSGKGNLNLEEIKNADMQVILSMGTGKISEKDISEADELQAQLDIPVILFSGDMEDYQEAYRLLGKVIGREADAETLIEYTSKIVADIDKAVAQIPEKDRITLYYAEGDDGLATEPASSNRSYVFNASGAVNVAVVDAAAGYGQSAVSMEQVLDWNPQVIITQGTTHAYETILSDPNWATIDAVKNGRVYKMPSNPFSWADRPPSVNRFIGLHWVTNLLYPDLYDVDIVDLAIDYYKVMYHVDVASEDMEGLLVDSVPRK